MGHMNLLPELCEPPKQKAESVRKSDNKRPRTPVANLNDGIDDAASDSSTPARTNSSSDSSAEATSECNVGRRQDCDTPTSSSRSSGGKSMSSFSGGKGRKDSAEREKKVARTMVVVGMGSSIQGYNG